MEDKSGGGRGGRLVPETVKEEGAELYSERVGGVRTESSCI